MKSSDIERLKPLAMPAYAVAVLLVVIPVLDTLMALLPARLGDVAWRFGALGLGSQALMTPMLGALLLLAMAVQLGHRRSVRVLQVLAWLVALGLLFVIALFLLDAAEVRAGVKVEAKPALDKASLLALGKYVVGVVVATMFAIASGRLAGRMRASAADDENSPRLFSTSGAKR